VQILAVERVDDRERARDDRVPVATEGVGIAGRVACLHSFESAAGVHHPTSVDEEAVHAALHHGVRGAGSHPR
jgi:hypothetical protein